METLDEKELEELIEATYRAEHHFFPEDGTTTYSGETYDLVVAMGMAIRKLVSHIRKLQQN